MPSLEASGGEQSITETLIRHLETSADHDYLLVSLATSAHDECSTRLASPRSWFAGPSSRKLEWRGRRVTHVGCSLAEIEWMRYRGRALLRTLLSPCDLLQVVCGIPAWGVAVLDCGKPVSIWAASRSQWERRAMLREAAGTIARWRRLMSRLTDRLDQEAVRRADALMVMNTRMREFATTLRQGAAEPVVYAPPGVDTNWYRPVEPRLAGADPTGMPYVLSVGRFGDSRKQPGLLLRAFARLRDTLAPALKLVLAGATKPPAAFWRDVSASGLEDVVSFHFQPTAGELRGLYQHALCFGLSSDEEGFGLALVEAMACGVPAVATRCGGPEEIITDSADGFLVKVGDEAAFSERLRVLCTDPDANREMGQRARQKVCGRFSSDATRVVFFDTWASLLERANHDSR